jgi:aromatic amino acid aminotransferase I
MTLRDFGDAILASEWTYPSAFATSRPLGIKPTPVPMYNEGMRSDALFNLLATWDENTRGPTRYFVFQNPKFYLHTSSSTILRPRVIYTVPIGQNPTGAVSCVVFHL